MTRIGYVQNYYGGLYIKQENNKYYWTIESYDDTEDWSEIPKYLYDSLVQYQKEVSLGKYKPKQ